MDEEAAKAEAEYWSKLKLAISPLTQEKVYVVTPQPPWDQQLVFNNDDSVVDEAKEGHEKSPRFMIRPTPQRGGAGTSYILGLTLSQSGESVCVRDSRTGKYYNHIVCLSSE